MEETSNSSIKLSVEESSQGVPIFDRDYWADEKSGVSTDKSIQDSTLHNIENPMAQTLQKEIKATKEGFYKRPSILEASTKEKGRELPNLNLNDPHKILKQGYLEKKTDGIIFKWRTRYMVLTPQKLYSFDNQLKEKALGCVNLKLLHADVQRKKEGLTLDFSGECENLLLKAESEQEELEWFAVLQKVVSYHSSQNKLFLKTLNKPLYQHRDTLTQRQFLRKAETGDILLFYTDHMAAKLQRFFTNSDFDHVAMIVKLKKRDPMVFESNQMHGVSIYDWKQYIQYFDLYGQVTLRKLNYIRKAEAQATLLAFMKKNLGKKYDIGLGKLLTFESDFNWEDVKEDRGYFCSELVAKALKSVGLLDEKRSSGRYWPVDFCEKSQMRLKKGASLGPEQAIILNKHTKNRL